MALSDPSPGGPFSGPRCPQCRGVLPEAAHVRTITVQPAPDEDEPITLRVVYCRRCGTALQMFEVRTPGDGDSDVGGGGREGG